MDHTSSLYYRFYLRPQDNHNGSIGWLYDIYKDVIGLSSARNVKISHSDLSQLLVTASFGADATKAEAVVRMLLDGNVDAACCDSNGNTALHGAAGRGYTKILEVLLDRKVNVDTQSRNGRSPLLIASAHGQTSAVRLLLAHGADISIADCDGLNALHLAAKGGYDETVSLLLIEEPALDSVTNQGIKAVHYAAAAGSNEVLEQLMKSGSSISDRTINSSSPLHFAAGFDHVETVRWLIEHGLDVNRRGGNMRTALHEAAIGGHVKVIKYLLIAGADINASALGDSGVSWTPLCFASNRGHLEAVDCLLRHDPDIDHRELAIAAATSSPTEPVWKDLRSQEDADKAGRRCHRDMVFFLACCADPDILQWTLDTGLDPNHRNRATGRTALHYAVYMEPAPQKRYRRTEMLLNAHADVQAADSFGRTALHMNLLRCRYDPYDNQGLLLKHGANPNARDRDANTALHYAARLQDPSYIQSLVANAGDLSAKNRKGQTPLHLAFDNLPVTAYILTQNVESDPLDDEGGTPLWYAAEGGHLDVTTLLLEAGADRAVKGPMGQTAIERI